MFADDPVRREVAPVVPARLPSSQLRSRRGATFDPNAPAGHYAVFPTGDRREPIRRPARI